MSLFLESIQDLIKDLKKTQHGDFTNKLYDITKDFHKEGGTWKHTILGVGYLSDILSGLKTKNPEFDWSSVNIDDIRSAILYHDIGKILTSKPSEKRPGSFSFPGHSDKKNVEKAFDQYGVDVSKDVQKLVYHHHDSPDKFSEFMKEEGLIPTLSLAIVKIADNMSVGPRSFDDAYEHVKPFIDKIVV